MTHVIKKVLISGHVQGVFFRDSTWRKANELKLQGGVRNLSDGRVEVIISGVDAEVQLLIKWLKIGPKHAKVTTIEVMDYADSAEQIQQQRQFEVWPTK